MSTAPHTPDTYDRLIDDLTYAYDGVFSPETIATVVHEARALLERALPPVSGHGV